MSKVNEEVCRIVKPVSSCSYDELDEMIAVGEKRHGRFATAAILLIFAGTALFGHVSRIGGPVGAGTWAMLAVFVTVVAATVIVYFRQFGRLDALHKARTVKAPHCAQCGQRLPKV